MNNRIVILMLILGSLMFCNAVSQVDTEDVFIRKLEKADGKEKIDLYIDLASYLLPTNPDKTIEYANKALELAVNSDDTKREADSYYQIANGYRMTGENLKSLDFFLKSLKAYTDVDSKEGISKSSNQTGRVYRYMGDYSTALEYHFRALRIFRELEIQEGVAESMIDIGISYRNLGKPDLALDYYNKALEASEATGDKKNIVDALVAKGNIYWYKDESDKALDFYSEALVMTRQEDYKGDNPAGIYNNIGNIHRRKGDFKKAFEYYDKSIAISRDIGDKNLIAVTLKNIGMAYKLSGNYVNALENFSQSKNLAEDIRLMAVHIESVKQLSETYSLLKDYKRALDYYKEFSNLNESLLTKETSNKISIMQLGHHLKNEAQKQTIREVDLTLKVLRERNIRNVIIFITILAVALIFILWSRYKLKLKTNTELRNLNEHLERRVEERTKRLREENDRRRIAQENAEMANETKSRFLANISHEVRTPINAIIGFCDLTIKAGIKENLKDNLYRIKDSSVHLLTLIKDVIDYSQIETGKIELKIKVFNLKDTLNSVINAFYLDAKSKKIKMTLNIDKNVPLKVKGDKDALQQILFNLVGNAIKFTEKGEVSIAVNRDENESVDDRIKLIFKVRDSGIGISKLKQKLIFMDFTQEYDSSARKYGGAGLGLTISKHFVELMDGQISVNSEKGKGSEFTFSVFLQKDKEIPQSQQDLISKKERKLHILIAEDNLLNAHVIVAFLNRLGHTSKVAQNGLEAIKELSLEDFDAVLMDIEMPEMDGLEATVSIRNGDSNVKDPNIPIIALTAHALRDYEEKSYNVGMNNYLTKPVDINQLAEVLQTINS